jgi:hypothetical protein
MILPFSTQLNGKPTYFVEKIWNGLLSNGLASLMEMPDFINWNDCKGKGEKIHTFRKDEKSRWKTGMLIHFIINNRSKDMKRFAPILNMKGKQRIFMTYAFNDIIQISVDGRELFGYHEREQLALNDGFDTWHDFFEYWYPIIQADPDKCFSGKIIHWTNLRY